MCFIRVDSNQINTSVSLLLIRQQLDHTQKQLKSLQKLEKKLLKSEKRKHEITLQKISKLKKNLFPNNSLQERFDNFIPFYLKDGRNFIEILLTELNPLAANFVILPLQ